MLLRSKQSKISLPKPTKSLTTAIVCKSPLERKREACLAEILHSMADSNHLLGVAGCICLKTATQSVKRLLMPSNEGSWQDQLVSCKSLRIRAGRSQIVFQVVDDIQRKRPYQLCLEN